MKSDLSNVLRLLAEKLDLSPAEFQSSTIVIVNGEVRVESPEPVKAPAKGKPVEDVDV